MGQFQSGLQSFLLLLLQVLEVLIFIRVILSWFPISAENRLVRLLFDLTEPVIAPFRRVIPQIGMFDLSTLAALLTIQFLSGAIAGRGLGFGF